MNGVTVRSARQGEAIELLRMYEWLFEPPGARPPSWSEERAHGALSDAISSERCAVLVAEQDDRRVGICTAYLDLDSVRYGRRCWVEDLAVDPALRSRGIGAALLAAARAWARAAGATHLELDTAEPRSDAQRFYERERPDARSISYGWRL